ncbi:MAG TPA: hypothetical protein VJP78_03890, partial [Thermoleophilia bacterium]|nr:hypothetical protein [Thermoleophilia bacterium]
VLVERNKEHAAALEARLRTVTPGAQHHVLRGDCNALVSQIVDAIGFRRPIIFAFVDPEGMEILWDTIESLASQFANLDLLINLTAGSERELGAIRATGKSPARLESFTGILLDQILLEFQGNVTQAYRSRVMTALGKQQGEMALIRGDQNQPLSVVGHGLT